jgi:hypothetical protein
MQALAEEMRRDPLLQTTAADLNIQRELAELFQASASSPRIFQVSLRPGMITQVNERLKRSGFGFIQVEISKPASLLTQLYDLASARFDRADPEVIKKLSLELYPETQGTKVIKVPHFDSSMLAAIADGVSRHEKSKAFEGYTFELDALIQSHSQLALPHPTQPLNHEAAFNKILASVRLGLVVPLGLLGSAFSGAWSPSSWAAGASVLGQEANFIRNSGRWNQFWQKFGLQGNIAMNLNFGALVTTMMIMTGAGMKVIEGMTAESGDVIKMSATAAFSVVSFVASYYALKVINFTKRLSVVAGMVGAMAAAVVVFGQYANVNLPEFLVKSLIINTTTFVASFGLGQIMLARLNHSGELSEGRRFRLESYLNFFGNVPRVIALGSVALAATTQPWFNLNTHLGDLQIGGINWTDIKFMKPEVYAWMAQATVFLTVGLPLLLKTSFGDRALDRQTADLLGKNGQIARGPLTRACDRALSWISKIYTPFWTRASRSR